MFVQVATPRWVASLLENAKLLIGHLSMRLGESEIPSYPCFPLGFYVGKIGSKRNARIVTVHSLNAKITWLKHCRNLGHGKLTAARGQL